MKYFIITIVASVIIAYNFSSSAVEGLKIVGIFIALYFVLSLIVGLIVRLSSKLPDSYQFQEKEINIPFLFFYSVKIPYTDIKEIKRDPLNFNSFSTTYLTFKPWGNVLIKTKSGKNYVLGPKSPEQFINEAKKHLIVS